jgi:hypothetical protein
MLLGRKGTLVYAVLLLAAFSFRFYLATFLPNDEPNDGKVYAQMARNLLEQHVYSHATEPPYEPSLIRLPGYPLFLAAIYSIFGHDNNRAVRVVQALTDTATCGLIGLIAFLWEPDGNRKRVAALSALALAAFCPFTAIYVTTILTETPTIFLASLMCLMASLAFRASSVRGSIMFWILAGAAAGIAVLFRPDSGLFAASIGLTLVIMPLFRGREARARRQFKFGNRLALAIGLASVFSIAFCLVLMPWTIRNQRVFHLFQPLAPTHAEMPGEFVPHGYLMWLRTWLDDERYIGPVLWSLDERPINIDAFPERAFDSPAEKATVMALLEKYDHPVDTVAAPQPVAEANSEGSSSPQGKQTDEAESQESKDDNDGNVGTDESDNTDESEDQSAASEEQNVEMTPDIDVGFAELARTRIAHAPLRYYLRLPLRRALSLWFDTHSQYYPFEGELFPLTDLDHDIHQHFWLPLFSALTWLYTLLGIAGGWCLWISGKFTSRRWLLLAMLVVLIRLAFFSSLENPEPRYVVEIFPFLAILGGIAIAHFEMLKPRGFIKRRSLI